MKPLTRILAATDLSAPARHAVDRAFRIAAETGAGLDIAHVVSQSALDTLRRLLAAQASPVEQHILEAVAANAGLRPDVVRICVHHGDASRVILTQEQELDCDLIVMGKHGQGVTEELLLGSVTKHILSESACDVLVANHPAPQP